jgi:hypothetical protein
MQRSDILDYCTVHVDRMGVGRTSAVEREAIRHEASYITSCAFAVASSPRCPAIPVRKLSIARLSGSAAGALTFGKF